MNDKFANQRSDHHDYTFDQHSLPRHEPKSRSPVNVENDKPSRHLKGSGSSSARLGRKSSKASGKEHKSKRSSPESEDRSLHRKEPDQDIPHSQKSNGPKHEEDVHNPDAITGPKLDQDVFSSQKIAGHKPIHGSRKSLIDNHSFRQGSGKNVHHVAFTAETCATQPAATP
jgi:hypothetical protein